MGWLSKIFSSGAASTIEAIGTTGDDLFTSDEERLQWQSVLAKIKQNPKQWQSEINKVEAVHRNLFVAGWRPSIGWVCSISLALYYIPLFAVGAVLWITMCIQAGTMVPYPVSAASLIELTVGILGLGTLRTFEKLKGLAK